MPKKLFSRLSQIECLPPSKPKAMHPHDAPTLSPEKIQDIERNARNHRRNNWAAIHPIAGRISHHTHSYERKHFKHTHDLPPNFAWNDDFPSYKLDSYVTSSQVATAWVQDYPDHNNKESSHKIIVSNQETRMENDTINAPVKLLKQASTTMNESMTYSSDDDDNQSYPYARSSKHKVPESSVPRVERRTSPPSVSQKVSPPILPGINVNPTMTPEEYYSRYWEWLNWYSTWQLYYQQQENNNTPPPQEPLFEEVRRRNRRRSSKKEKRQQKKKQSSSEEDLVKESSPVVIKSDTSEKVQKVEEPLKELRTKEESLKELKQDKDQVPKDPEAWWCDWKDLSIEEQQHAGGKAVRHRKRVQVQFPEFKVPERLSNTNNISCDTTADLTINDISF